MIRLFVFASLFFCVLGLSQATLAQCATPIPGLPAGAFMPCGDPFTPNTPSDPLDGPNAAGSPNAEKFDRDACDADFMNQIYARSFLETNREIMITGSLVKKPDSVLEYTCFDQKVRDTAFIADTFFSGSEYWTGGGAHTTISNPGTTFPTTITIDVYMGEFHLDQSLNQVVMRSLNQFVNVGNFNHNFLGGAAGIGLDAAHRIQPNVAAALGSCTNMMEVWDLAKCENVNITEMFRYFSQLVGTDPRNIDLPGCTANPISNDLIDVANNQGGVYSFNDPVTHYNDFTDYTSACMNPPIPTGLIVTRETMTYSNTSAPTSTPSEHIDYVCPNPGCFFEPGGSTCKQDP